MRGGWEHMWRNSAWIGRAASKNGFITRYIRFMNFVSHLRRTLAALAAVACFSATVNAQILGTKSLSHVVTTPHVRAELMVFAPDGIQAGKSLTVGLQIQHQPGWHTYWKNPGDSGLPTQLTWKLPAGLDTGEIQWPTPKKIPVSALANYGYEGLLLLPVTVKVAETFNANSVDAVLQLKAQWLVCKTECVPEEGEFVLKVPVRGSTALNRGLFEAAQKSLPAAYTGSAVYTPQDNALRLTLAGLPAQWRGKQLEAFPELADIIPPSAKQVQTWDKETWAATIPLFEQRSASPSTMTWLVKIAGGQSNPAVIVQAKLEGRWPAGAISPTASASSPGVSPALKTALSKNAAAEVGHASNGITSLAFWLAVLGAFAGGLILNLMPCVLPVLAIKLLSFAPKKIIDTHSSVATIRFEHTQMPVIHSDDTLSFRASSGLFALGVVGSFVLLGFALLALRAAGQSLGWGFQLQSPVMVVGLMVLFLLIGLNLFDAFDVNVLLPTRWANFHSENPSMEALASGVLAVLVATPCTAPFMGASLGLAVSLPAWQAFVIFLALGLGMALPFLLIAAFPAIGGWLLKILPKPGGWMSVLRHFLAWPVFATVIWLLWVYAQQTSINSAFAVMLSLLMVVALMWSLRLHKSRLKSVIAGLFAVCLFASFFLWPGPSASAQSQRTAQSEGAWQTWSPAVQQAALAQGQPVLVDFTAAWCITCQVNKSAVLNNDAMLATFKAKKVLLLRADWTRPDSTIAAELSKLGRTGLPVYALYLPGSQVPQLLPELLTTGTLRDALAVL
jgi:thiol:disulfide interchange protein/DsbC/DsbD-like thiol-disulfide interchange protein